MNKAIIVVEVVVSRKGIWLMPLLEEIDILSESTKRLGNDRINDIKEEMKKRGAI